MSEKQEGLLDTKKINDESYSEIKPDRGIETNGMGAGEFSVAHRFGEHNKDVSELDDNFRPDLSPHSKQRALKEDDKTQVKRLGDMATFFSLLKGMVCTGVIYLPRNLYNGGWAFSTFALLLAYALTLFCSIKLV